METTALSDLWRDIETTEPNDRRKLAKELGLPDLQARVLVQDRQLSQAIEGDDWLLIQLELPEVKRRDVVLRNLTLLLGASQIVTIHAGALDAEIAERVQTRHRESLTPSLIASIILQYTVEQFTPILNKIDDVTDQLEDTMIRTPQRKQVQQLFMYKRQLADLRKVVLSLMNTTDFPSGEMWGNQELRVSSKVIWVCSEPSAFMRQTCMSPVRTELNQMYCPQGEYSGPSSRPSAVVRRVSSPPSTGMV